MLYLSATKYWLDKNTLPLEIGQVVLIREDSMAKGAWKLGRVVSMIEGRDGLIRKVRLKTATGTIERHINKLSLLEGAALKAQQEKMQSSAPPIT